MQKLEQDEQERSVALHAELNRQIKLQKWEEQHIARFAKLQKWVAEKNAYLQHKEVRFNPVKFSALVNFI